MCVARHSRVRQTERADNSLLLLLLLLLLLCASREGPLTDPSIRRRVSGGGRRRTHVLSLGAMMELSLRGKPASQSQRGEDVRETPHVTQTPMEVPRGLVVHRRTEKVVP